jgi:hypothetical protein
MGDAEVLEESTEETTSDVESQETPTETEQTEYEFDVNGEKIKLDRDKFNEVLSATKNAEKWDKKYHEKGRKLNQFQRELQDKEKELATDKQLLDEWKAVKKKLDADPEARKFVAGALNESKPSIDPVVKAQSDEIEKLRKDIERDRAIQKMQAKYQDFNDEELAEFQANFNLADMFDVMEYTYLAKKGASIDDEIQKARVEVVKGMKSKKGAPPTGKKTPTPPPEPKTFDEMVRMAKLRVDNEGTILGG